MEIMQLRHFAVAAEHRNLSKAAKELNQSTSTLSRSIQRLEEAVGGRLFERTAHGLTLSGFGTTLLEYAQAILNEHDRAVVAMDAVRKTKSGIVRIGVVPYLADFGIPEATIALIRRFPKAGADISDGPHEELIRRLRIAELDIAVTTLTTPLVETDLVFEPVVACDLIHVVGTAHPLARKKSVTITDIRNARMVISNRPTKIRSYYRNIVDMKDQTSHHPLIVSSALVTRKLLLSGEIVTVCPRYAVAEDIKAGLVVELPTKVFASPPPIGILLRKKGVKSGLIVSFVRDLRAALREAGGELEAL